MTGTMSDDIRKAWERTEVIQLINEWKSHPELWDFKMVVNRRKRKNTIKYLADMFSTNVFEINRKFHNLRTQYNQELKRIKTKGAKVYRTSWEFFSLMKFLSQGKHADATPTNNLNNEEERVKHPDDSAGSSSITSTASNPEKRLRRVESDEDQPLKNFMKKQNSEETNGTKSSSKKRHQESEVDYERLLQKAACLMNTPPDQFQIFGDFVASELRNLKSTENQRKLKLDIQRAILRASEIDLYAVSAPPSHSRNGNSVSSLSSYLTDYDLYEIEAPSTSDNNQ